VFLSLLEELVPLGWLVVDDGGIVAFVVAVANEAVGVVFVDTADGRSLIHTASETKWYPVGQFPPGSGRSTIGTLVVALVLLPLPMLLGNCVNGEVIVFGVAADAKDGFTVFEMPQIRASVVLTTLRSGLLGLHIFALSSGDIIVLGELAVDDCWAYA